MISLDLQIEILKRIPFQDFTKLKGIIPEQIYENILIKYKRVVNLIENNISRRRFVIKNKLTWVTKFSYEKIRGNLIIANIKYADSFMRAQFILPEINTENKWHHMCTNCTNFYPSLLCLLMCRHFCNCNDCVYFVKNHIVGGFILKIIPISKNLSSQ